MEKQVASAYPTPIGRFKVPNSEAVNRALRRVILEKEQSEPSSDYANVGGWHSRADLLDWPLPEVGALKGWITEAVNHMVATVTEGRPVRGSYGISAWANVARTGNYHRIHNHPRSAWSGVYYVEIGAADPKHPLAGVLELCDPRPFTEMVSSPGDPFGKRVIFRPEPGMMVLFPSWVYHFVNPFQGTGERISIAFNCPWQDRPTG
ncbi:MAG TPA: TIGR02466 family protein [Gemmataceae bacterium]|nr:TIGR02466 family protein [Gemmataceae bacterium]